MRLVACASSCAQLARMLTTCCACRMTSLLLHAHQPVEHWCREIALVHGAYHTYHTYHTPRMDSLPRISCHARVYVTQFMQQPGAPGCTSQSTDPAILTVTQHAGEPIRCMYQKAYRLVRDLVGGKGWHALQRPTLVCDVMQHKQSRQEVPQILVSDRQLGRVTSPWPWQSRSCARTLCVAGLPLAAAQPPHAGVHS